MIGLISKEQDAEGRGDPSFWQFQKSTSVRAIGDGNTKKKKKIRRGQFRVFKELKYIKMLVVDSPWAHLVPY